MAIGSDRSHTQVRETARAADIDVGLRVYMQKVLALMAGGTAVTGLVAFLTAQSPAMLELIYGTPLRWVVFLAPIGIALLFGLRIHAMRASTAQMVFWLFSAVMGLSLASIFIVYTGESIARALFIAAATFAGMALYGYTTKRDLSGIGAFLIMGVWGLLIAMIVNIFLASSALQMTISIIGVLIFTGLTAYDAQKSRRCTTRATTPKSAPRKPSWARSISISSLSISSSSYCTSLATAAKAITPKPGRKAGS